MEVLTNRLKVCGRGDLVVIEFPDMQQAKNWYESPAYQRIKYLRINNTVSTVVLVEGSPDCHKATDILVDKA
jgi:uncharacterized protein (DUF1330 family)